MRKKQLKEAENLALSIEVWARADNLTYIYANHIRHKFNVDAGMVRRALKLLCDKGLIQQVNRSNWAFGSVLRGMRRSWKFKP